MKINSLFNPKCLINKLCALLDSECLFLWKHRALSTALSSGAHQHAVAVCALQGPLFIINTGIGPFALVCSTIHCMSPGFVQIQHRKIVCSKYGNHRQLAGCCEPPLWFIGSLFCQLSEKLHYCMVTTEGVCWDVFNLNAHVLSFLIFLHYISMCVCVCTSVCVWWLAALFCLDVLCN